MITQGDEDETDDRGRVLEWGHTPFDNMSQAELLRHCQRFYAACNSMTSVLAISRAGQEDHPYWGPGGSGARALAMGEQAMMAVDTGIDKESIYRAFYRYAVDLLFESKGAERIGFDWHICPVCGVMVGPMRSQPASFVGQLCDATKDCTGVMRLITWDDLKPLEATNG